MRIAGVIAEFDPFHNGHAYFLRRVRELTSADFIVAVMSGDYTQRGSIASCSKRLRTRMALMSGADVVAELPMQYATASAELFASGGVSVLGSTGIVDVIAFGTEEEDMGRLRGMAEMLGSESEGFKEKLTEGLKEGMTYPAARMRAAMDIAGGEVSGAEDLMSSPNNILALEYLKALKNQGLQMETLNVKREATDHDGCNTYGIYSSAKNIREIMKRTRSFDPVSIYLPEGAGRVLREHFGEDAPLFDDDMSSLMRYRLITESIDSLMEYADMSGDLARRIMKHRGAFLSVSQFTELVKTRNITYTRISRALLHMLLSVRKADMELLEKAGGYPGAAGYIRILGFRREASSVVDAMTEKGKVPVITRCSDYRKTLEGAFARMFEDGLKASDIYCSLVKDVYDTDMTPDISCMSVEDEGMILTLG